MRQACKQNNQEIIYLVKVKLMYSSKNSVTIIYI